jgi:hypothetical protein
MPPRQSDEMMKRLQAMPVQDKGRAIVLVAARMGKSQSDLVRIVLEKVLRIETLEQVEEIAEVWAPLVGLKRERFVEIAAEIVVQRTPRQ